jgi:hypothetical protein
MITSKTKLGKILVLLDLFGVYRSYIEIISRRLYTKRSAYKIWEGVRLVDENPY